MIKLLITKNREKILNRAKGYYENNKKRLRKQEIPIENYLMTKKK